MSLIVNLFGGPCCGKTLVMADIYQKLKKQDYDVEMVFEYAKELTWDNDMDTLKDQKVVLEEQNRRIKRLVGKVDIILTDSPTYLSMVYFDLRNPIDSKEVNEKREQISKLCRKFHNENKTFNIYLNRLKDATYSSTGRADDEETSKGLDVLIKELLIQEQVDFIESNSLYADRLSRLIIESI